MGSPKMHELPKYIQDFFREDVFQQTLKREDTIKLSERIRKWRHVSEGWHLGIHEIWADEAEELEAENEDLRTKLVAGEDLYISKGIELARCRKLAHSYIEAYEKLAYGDAIKEESDLIDTKECGCEVTKGFRCPVHSDP